MATPAPAPYGPPTPPGPYGPPAPPFGGMPPAGPDGPAPEQGTKRRRWPWVLGIVVAFVVGTGIGSSGEEASGVESAPTGATGSEVANLQASLDATQEQLEQVAGQRDAALGDLGDAQAARASAQEDLTAAEDERDAAIARAEEAEGALADAEGAAADEAEAAESAGTQFGDGTWVVGEDIEPGVYRNSGDGSYCYWERLSGLSGEFDDIIANGAPDGPAVVEIASSDAAFSSQGCDSWSRQ